MWEYSGGQWGWGGLFPPCPAVGSSVSPLPPLVNISQLLSPTWGEGRGGTRMFGAGEREGVPGRLSPPREVCAMAHLEGTPHQYPQFLPVHASTHPLVPPSVPPGIPSLSQYNTRPTPQSLPHSLSWPQYTPIVPSPSQCIPVFPHCSLWCSQILPSLSQSLPSSSSCIPVSLSVPQCPFKPCSVPQYIPVCPNASQCISVTPSFPPQCPSNILSVF